MAWQPHAPLTHQRARSDVGRRLAALPLGRSREVQTLGLEVLSHGLAVVRVGHEHVATVAPHRRGELTADGRRFEWRALLRPHLDKLGHGGHAVAPVDRRERRRVVNKAEVATVHDGGARRRRRAEHSIARHASLKCGFVEELAGARVEELGAELRAEVVRVAGLLARCHLEHGRR